MHVCSLVQFKNSINISRSLIKKLWRRRFCVTTACEHLRTSCVFESKRGAPILPIGILREYRMLGLLSDCHSYRSLAAIVSVIQRLGLLAGEAEMQLTEDIRLYVGLCQWRQRHLAAAAAAAAAARTRLSILPLQRSFSALFLLHVTVRIRTSTFRLLLGGSWPVFIFSPMNGIW